jgi:hypothetical protein
LLESDKQVVGPVSTQAPLDWRLSEWGDEFIGVYTDANIVMGAESADFFLDCWYSKVITDGGIWYVPGASTISRKTLDCKRSKMSMSEFDVVPQSWMPLCPDRFEYYFVEEESVVDREFGLAPE